VQKAVLGAAVVVTKFLRIYILLTLALIPCVSVAAVLPADRADVLYHSYEGGGISITGPAVLVRKSIGDSVSLSAKNYIDTISSASIDVEMIVGASTYEEERVENSFSIDLLNEKTIMSLGYTNSVENDFTADTFAFGISQDMFGDLTTISMGYAHGENIVGKTGDASFQETSKSDSFKIGVSQVITKNMLMALSVDTITDEGFLNNPYRKTRYIDPGDSTSFILEDEIYPGTRTSNAYALRTKYFLPYRAALHAEYRIFKDSWGIDGSNIEVGYTHPVGENWIFDIHYRTYSQTKADFYNDLFPFSNSQNFIGRDKELSTYTNNTLGFGASYEFIKNESGNGAIDKASINFKFDHIVFNYTDFRDATQTSFDAGTEPLYTFDANVMQLFLSVWF